jgi:hypothetical protein
MKRRIPLVIVLLALVATGVAIAAHGGFGTKTEAFNPGNAQVSDASTWVDGAGVPGGTDNQGLVLLLSQLVTFPPGASADATITNVDGTVLTSLGMDHMLGTACTNGSPRWDVETTNGGVYGVGCASGTHSTAGMPAGWERITFSNADFQNLSGPAFTGFGTTGATLSFLQLLQDEAGVAVVDNLNVNGTVIGSKNANQDEENDDNDDDNGNNNDNHGGHGGHGDSHGGGGHSGGGHDSHKGTKRH